MKKLFAFAALIFVAALGGCLAFAQEGGGDAPVAVVPGVISPGGGGVATTDDGVTFTQIMAIIVAVVFAARLIVKLTPTPADDSALEKVVSFLKHIGLKLKCLLFFCLLPSALCLTGCAPVQVRAGADPIVVVAEWTAENSLNAIDSFLAFERANEAELLKRSQAIHAAADHLREVAPAEIKNLRALTRQYKWDKTAANGDQVVAATKALLALANSVRGHMGLPPLIPPIISPSATDLLKAAPPQSRWGEAPDEPARADSRPTKEFFSYHIPKAKQTPCRTASPIEALKTSNLQKSDHAPRRSVADIRQFSSARSFGLRPAGSTRHLCVVCG